MRTRSRSIPLCACTTSRSRSRVSRARRPTRAGCEKRSRANGELEGLELDPTVLDDLQSTLRAGEWRVTAAVHDENTITAVWPGLHDRAYGIAFDVGSTTVAGHLCDLTTGEVLASAGEMNPQIRFGEDLMSRVSYVMLNPESREGADPRRPRLPRQAHRRAREGGGDRPARRPRGDGRRQPDHAPPPARPRSDRARRSAVRARDRGLPAPGRLRPRAADPPRRSRVRPPLHRRSRGRGHRRDDPLRGPVPRRGGQPPRRRGDERRDRAREQGPPARGLEPHRPRFRGRADHLRPARGGGRDRARADRSGRRSSPGSG